MPVAAPFPKIELHVHLEGTVRPPALLEIARRNGVDLGVTDDAAWRLVALDRLREGSGAGPPRTGRLPVPIKPLAADRLRRRAATA